MAGLLRDISATRGKGGCLKLASEPEDISIGDVIRQAKAGTGLVNCARKNRRYYAIERSCGSVTILDDAHGAFFDNFLTRGNKWLWELRSLLGYLKIV